MSNDVLDDSFESDNGLTGACASPPPPAGRCAGDVPVQPYQGARAAGGQAGHYDAAPHVRTARPEKRQGHKRARNTCGPAKRMIPAGAPRHALSGLPVCSGSSSVTCGDVCNLCSLTTHTKSISLIHLTARRRQCIRFGQKQMGLMHWHACQTTGGRKRSGISQAEFCARHVDAPQKCTLH